MLTSLQVCFNAVAPLFLIMALGYGAKCLGAISVDAVPSLNKLAFRYFMPVMLFRNLYDSSLSHAVQPRLLLFAVAAVLAMYGLSMALVLSTEKDPEKQGVKIQGMYRSNLAIIGLPLAKALVPGADMGPVAMLAAVIVPLFNVLAVITLETCRGGAMDLGKTLGGILRNPLIVGCLLGFVFLFSGLRLPSPVEQTVRNLGSAGSVTTLLALGASFELSGVAQNRKAIIHCTLHRLLTAPLLGLAAAILLGLRGDSLGIVLVCLAAPTASTAYPIALACDSDHQLTAQLVVITSLLCTFTLFCWIFFLKQFGLL